MQGVTAPDRGVHGGHRYELCETEPGHFQILGPDCRINTTRRLSYVGRYKFMGDTGVLAPNGCVYFAPCNAEKVLQVTAQA